jgi:hypothetical protein
MRWSLHCAVHDETVNSFGRDDGFYCSLGREQRDSRFLRLLWKNRQRQRQRQQQISFGDDNKKTTATAEAKEKYGDPPTA